MSYAPERNSGLSSPPAHAFAITPDDNSDLSRPTRALMVAMAGDVQMVTVAGDTVILPALQSGMQYAIRAARVMQTGTTASGIVGLA